MYRRARNGSQSMPGPEWERRPVRPIVGVRVAVHGYCEVEVSRLVVGLIGGELRENEGEFVFGPF